MTNSMAGDPAARRAATVVVRPQTLAAECLDYIALEGRAGVAVAVLLDAMDPVNDIGLRRHVWRMLQRQHALGVLQFFYSGTSVGSSSNVNNSDDGDGHPSKLPVSSVSSSSSQPLIGKKRKRPTGGAESAASDQRNGTGSAPASPVSHAPRVWPNNSTNSASDDGGSTTNTAAVAADTHHRSNAQQPSSPDGVAAPTHPQHRSPTPAAHDDANSSFAASPVNTQARKPANADSTADPIAASPLPACTALSPAALAALSLDDALLVHQLSGQTLMAVACRELRLRALNLGASTALADDHFAILEAVGRARVRGATVTALSGLVLDASVKRLHSALDTLLSHELVVKRMLIVAKPTMRRLNIVHLPRFAGAFVPRLYDATAEFESDDASKRIVCAAAEAYLKTVPGHSCVLADLGRDLQLQKRHVEVLRSHVQHEAKRDDAFRLELFQAVLRPTKRSAGLEPKILNCIRYKPPVVSSTDSTTTQQPQRSGIAVELGLLQQIYQLIDARGAHGATITELRQQIVLPGNKLPYKLVSVLAGRYALEAETFIQGKNKAFRLYTRGAPALAALVQRPRAPLLLTDGSAAAADATLLTETGAGATDAASRRSLKGALGGLEVDGTRTRRRTHILERLVRERIISLSSLRASVFRMERHVAEREQSAVASATACFSPPPLPSAAVGMVDQRSISRIAEELERDGALRLLQLPLPAKNVSTKLRALKCVVFPGFEHDEQSIQRFVQHYCRDERLRRIHQNAERHGVIRLRGADSDSGDDDDVDVNVDTVDNSVGGNADNVDDSVNHGVGLVAGTDASVATSNGVAMTTTPSPLPTRGSKRKRDDDARIATATATTATATPSSALVVVAQPAPFEISYRIRRFRSQATSSAHAHQYRKLGFAYGVMYRCKIFHEFLWTHLHTTAGDATLSSTAGVLDPLAAAAASDPSSASGLVFSREAVLHAMPVWLYIAVFSGGDVLAPNEFAAVEAAVAAHATFDALAPAVCAKLWSHESQRTAKVLGVLTDLALLAPHKIGMTSLLQILRAGYSDGRDGVLSRALKDNALGGLFLLQRRAQIVLDDRSTGSTDSPRQSSVNDLPALRLVGTTERHYSFGHVLPLRFAFASARDVARYWEALECLCLESMVMEVAQPKRHEATVCPVPKPVKTRSRRMLRILAWISKSRKTNDATGTPGPSTSGNGHPTTAATAKSKPKPTIRKRISRAGSASKALGSRTKSQAADAEAASKKARRRAQRALALARDEGADSDHDVDNDLDADDTTGDRLLKKRNRSTAVWTDADDRELLALYLAYSRRRWHITVPQGLQRDNERIAFRTTRLARAGFELVTIARALSKRRMDVKKRLKEVLAEPAAKRAVEVAKCDAVAREHPTGVFDEEVAIVSSPRLTALFRRAVLLVVAPLSAYHPLVAEELIAHWSAAEIRLVWRYLWLKNWIVKAAERDRDRARGYTPSQRLQDFLKLTTLAFPLRLFQQAAAHESLISATLDEARSSRDETDNEQLFEAAFPVNATPGQCALELAGQVLGTCSLVARHANNVDLNDVDTGVAHGDAVEAAADPNARTARLQHRKRSLRLLHYKSLKSGSGFAAHLAKHMDFQKPSLLMDSWHVETRVHALTLDDRAQLQQLEAFSFAPPSEQLVHKRRRLADKDRCTLERTVVALVRASGDAGLALPELLIQVNQQQRVTTNTSVTRASVCTCVDALVDAGTLLCVNAYAQQRFVAKEHGDVWLLRPFTVVPAPASASAPTPPRVVFAAEKDTLSFPWLQMDGSTHSAFLFALQRKVLALVLTSPGITEQSVFSRLERLLTLQDTREALATLVDEGLLYIRGTRVHAPSLFCRSTVTSRSDAVVHLTGHALAVDRAKFVVHYFPHVECVQRFGSIVQDDDDESDDVVGTEASHRGA